jgi:uncharacterized protein YecE (DUF72 family)
LASVNRAAIYLGTAAWAIPKTSAEHFPAAGSHLDRYAARLGAVEINSTFRQWHQTATYARWAAGVPAAFRFALKLPQAITHEAGLAGCDDLLARFLADTSALGQRRGPLLVQLPPSLAFSPGTARDFFQSLRRRYEGPAVCEPRHASWFAPEAERLLVDLRIARAAADPAPQTGAGQPAGWPELAYYRWHGQPRIYYSNYEGDALGALAPRLVASSAAGETWCIFDNTALGFATANALQMHQLLGAPDSHA